jgi:hypothetical protein
VDFGSKKKDTYFKAPDKINAQTNSPLTPTQLQTLKDKLSSYLGLKRAKACQYLQAHLLNLGNDELNLLNNNEVQNTISETKKAYKKINPKGDFTQLSQNQQTILFSETYQRGPGRSLFKTTAAEYGNGNSNYDPPGREHGWINQ